MAPTALDHVALNVPDVPAAVEFYSATLGLTQNSTLGFGFAGTWLHTANGQQVQLIELPAPPNAGQYVVFVCEDNDAVVGQRDRAAPAASLSRHQPVAR